MSDFSPLHVLPRLADPGFTVLLHREFRLVDLPAEHHDAVYKSSVPFTL